MPEKNLPFFEMFALYTPDAALAAQVKAWLVTGAVMDRKARTIEVQLLCPAMPDPALLARLSGEVARTDAIHFIGCHAHADTSTTD